ncbi:Mss4-like protein [Fennellomyces sp. T-0311]|nr:Mss4-like protein [Fennellomyces sp. T-0311]
MAQVLTGSCLCGSIKVKLNGEPIKAMTCHCVDCQKSAGGPFQSNAIYNTSAVELEDPNNYAKLYIVPKTQTGSGYEKQKWFCGNCGSPLFNRPMKYEGQKSVVKTGILDAPAGFQGSALDQLKPVSELYVKDRASYVHPVDGAKQWEEAAPAPAPAK